LVVAVALWMAAAPGLPAAVVLSDSFTYPDGALVTVGQTLWSNYSGTAGQVQVVSGEVFLSQANSEDVHAFLSGQPYAPTTNISLYASFSFRLTSLPSGKGEYFAMFKTTGTSGFNDRLFVTTNVAGLPTNSYRVGVANGATNFPTAILSSNLAVGTTYELVTRYEVSRALATIWLSPAAESDPSATATDVASATNTITCFGLRESLASGNGMGSLYVDNLVVGTSFEDVVPGGPASPPVITLQPRDQSVVEGSNVTFTVGASGYNLHYQWQFNTNDLPGKNGSTLDLPAVTTNQAGFYSVVITNSAGSTNSDYALLTVAPLVLPPSVVTQPQDLIVNEGANATFSVVAGGTEPLYYQWRRNGSPLAGGTNSTLMLTSVTVTQSGEYSVTITNAAGSTNSRAALLTVNPNQPASAAITVMQYNVKGNGVTDWSTNSAQVQAIGRQIQHLNPDIITFNEIPRTNAWQMQNWANAFFPGFYLATNSGTDGFIRSAIASRYPIARSQSWLDGASLLAFGYNGTFTRDLFEAQIAVPGFDQPLHVFTTHLKSSTTQDAANRRAAEASAISNFLVTVFLTTNASHPYLLTGDLNEDVFRAATNSSFTSGNPIGRLTSTPTGLRLTTPLNPITGQDFTFSIATNNTLDSRYDYILPSGLLFSNLVSSQVFRTDLLTNPPPPPPLLTNDDRTASDHLPVLASFANPYQTAFRLLSITRTNEQVTLVWESVDSRQYSLEASSNLLTWEIFATNLTATGPTRAFSSNLPEAIKFFRVYRVP
jgi:endonuclease/exonuclease/phosphatase family metal-dependent hydrolase